MSLPLLLYVLALCACAAAIIYGIVRPERSRPPEPAVPPSDEAAPKRPQRLAA